MPDSIKVYGAPVKGCKIPEAAHMGTFFNWLRLEHPEHAAIALHIRNEGKRTKEQMTREKAQGGFVKGAADIILPGNPSFVCEMKSQSPSAKVSPEQISYLIAAQKNGAFACVAIGYEGAITAFCEWIANKC